MFEYAYIKRDVMSTNELKQNQKLILEKLDALSSDRVTKNDLEKVENKLGERITEVENKLGERITEVENKLGERITEISSQLKEINDNVFSNEDSVRNRVARLENDYQSIKKDNTIIKRSALFILIGVVGFWIKELFF